MSDDPRSLPIPDGWAEALASWEDLLRAGGATGPTIATRTDHGRRVARALGGTPAAVTAADLLAWVGGQSWARETRRSVYASLRSLWRHLLAAGFVESDPTTALPKVRPAPAHARPIGERAYRRAVAAATGRVALILRLAGEAGLRREEIAKVHASDLLEDLAGRSLVVHGKGGKDRVVPLSDDVARLVARECLAGGGWALPGGVDGHLSARYVGKLAADALASATLHQLRHRFATVAYGGTRDLLAVQLLLGHTSPATTQRYVRPPDDALRAAMLAAC